MLKFKKKCMKYIFRATLTSIYPFHCTQKSQYDIDVIDKNNRLGIVAVAQENIT